VHANGGSEFSHLAPFAGEVGAKRRVRGIIRESGPVESAPHPNPPRASFARLDPASGEREQVSMIAMPQPNLIPLWRNDR
jgi:hypothetical protein